MNNHTVFIGTVVMRVAFYHQRSFSWGTNLIGKKKDCSEGISHYSSVIPQREVQNI